MELTSAQRKLVFAGVVVVLAALGAFLIIPNTLGRTSTGHGRAVGLTAPLSTSSPIPSPASQPTPAGGLGSTPAPGTGPDIYSWLPFSQAGLAAAADLVHKFAAAYASYTYTQSTASYERQFNGLATTQLITVLARGFATPGYVFPRLVRHGATPQTVTVPELVCPSRNSRAINARPSRSS